MAAIRPRSALAPLAALCSLAAVGYITLYGFGWNDYEAEALRSVQALVGGHLARFASAAPSYGGSLLLRAPFALLPSLWGGGQLAVYRALAAPCLLAAGALGLWVDGRMRRGGASLAARGVALALLVCNPIVLPTIECGHPEEILCAVLCVTAVLLAARERPLLAGVALGIAIGCKYWPVIAVGPVLLALPARRWRCLAATALSAALLLAPIALLNTHFVAASSTAASTSSAIFQPWQIFWFLGWHGNLLHGAFGVPEPGFRTPPAWVGPISHPLLVTLAIVAAAALAIRRGGGRAPRVDVHDALLLLAFAMLIRCLLDTLDYVGYTVPFLFALLAWECEAGRSFAARGPPLLTIGASALCWASFGTPGSLVSADVESAFFLAWTVPLCAVIALRLYAPTTRLRLGLPSRRFGSVASTTGWARGARAERGGAG
ncbi:MAG: glycosyltransferase 87 family protein [Solirubrobacteraceae bacterium]